MDAETLMEILTSRNTYQDCRISNEILIICNNEADAKCEMLKDYRLNYMSVKEISNQYKKISFKNGLIFKYMSKNSKRYDGIKIRRYEIRTNSIVIELFEKVKKLRQEISYLKQEIKDLKH